MNFMTFSIVLGFIGISMARPQFNGGNPFGGSSLVGNPGFAFQSQTFPNPFFNEQNQRFPNPAFQNQISANQNSNRPQFNQNGAVISPPNQSQIVQQQRPQIQTQLLQQQPQPAPGNQPSIPTASIVGTPAYLQCNANCITTNQYNPVCGSDTIQYNNQARLDCANQCGRRLDSNWQDITVLRRGACSSGQRVS